MKIHLLNGDLEKIREAALYAIKNKSNSCIEADIWPTLCIIKAFASYVNRLNVPVEVTMKANTRLEVTHLEPVVVQCSDPEWEPDLQTNVDRRTKV